MSERDPYVVIPNWSRFQHYDPDVRNPPWIKLYTELNSRDDWVSLTVASRGILSTAWLEYARARGILRVSTLMSLCGSGTRLSQLKPLIDAGFIQLSASKPLAEPSRARSREIEKEKKTPLPPLGENHKSGEKSRREQKPEWRPNNEPTRTNVQARDPVAAIQALIRNGVIRDQVDLDAELAGYRLDAELTAELRATLELQSVSNLLESEQT